MKLIHTIPGSVWSAVDERCLNHNGIIVDLGCLHWDWSKFFIGKKRIVGVDPFENQIDGVELFKGAISDNNGIAHFNHHDHVSNMFSNGKIEVKTLNWKSFCKEYNIENISVLKVNIEGAEYQIIKNFDKEDFDKIDQIAISFHDFINPVWKDDTIFCINKILENGYDMVDTCYWWGWKLFIKK